MRKSLSSLWLKSFKRISKVQQRQGRDLLQSLLGTPAPAKRKRVGAVKKVLTSIGLLQAPSASRAAVRSKPAKPVKTAKSAKPVSMTSKLRSPAQKTLSARAVPAQGQWLRSFHLELADGLAPPRRMDYWLFVPSRPASEQKKPMPLVVMLHGCTQTANDFAQGTRMNALAQRKGFAVLYPQQLATVDHNRCWHWHLRATQQGGGEVRWVVGAIEKVMKSWPIDASRVYVAGLSAGAALAQIVALRHPNLIAAVGLHSAPVFGTVDSRMGAFSAMQHGSSHSLVKAVDDMALSPEFPGMPAILVQGDADKVVRSVNLMQLAQQFRLVNHLGDAATPAIAKQVAARLTGRSPRHGYEVLDYVAGRTSQVRVPHPRPGPRLERRRRAVPLPFRDRARRKPDDVEFLSHASPQRRHRRKVVPARFARAKWLSARSHISFG
jgi:poly(hydroxyalkanoate) depolymerase family esterase